MFKYASYGEAVKAFKSAEVDVIVTNMSEWKDKFGTIGLNIDKIHYHKPIPLVTFSCFKHGY